MQAIVPCLWFDKNAEEAVKFYLEVFKDGKITDTTYFTEAGQEIHKQPAGLALTVEFELHGQKFTALNGGPQFKFNEAVSLQVMCDDQAEVDDYWQKLSAVPEAEACGWLKDKFGLSWQIVPKELPAVLNDADPARAARIMESFMRMKKIDLAALKAVK